MVKKFGVIMVLLVFVVSFGACRKKEERMPAGHQAMPGMASMPKVNRVVIVSKEVKAKWKAVKVAVVNKTTMAKKVYTVNIGSTLAIPSTKMSVKVVHFLPDFKMTNKEFYSRTNEPNQPAAQIVVTDDGKEIFNNWLFALQQSVHPFNDPNGKIGITLVEGVSK
jgi:hypothetical protein